MTYTEKALLSCFIMDNSLLEAGVENLFEIGMHKEIYKEMIKLKKFEMVDLAENMRGKIELPYVFIANLLDYRTHWSYRYLREDSKHCINKLIEDKKKRNILIKLNKHIKSPLFDWDGIKDEINSVEQTDDNEEDGKINILNMMEEKELKSGHKTSYSTFDRLIGNLRLGELFLLMGRTGTGKTWIFLNILNYNILKTKDAIGFFSLEMPHSSVLERMFQLNFDKSKDEINSEFINNNKSLIDLFEKDYQNLKLFHRIYSVEDIKVKIRNFGFKIIFIDFLGLIKSEKFNSPYERTSNLITDLKKLAKEENILIFLAHQLSRQAEDGSVPVKLHHARDSGVVEELSDFLIGIWRPEIAEQYPSEDSKNKLFMELLKNKRGETRRIECYFNKKSGRIREILKKN